MNAGVRVAVLDYQIDVLDPANRELAVALEFVPTAVGLCLDGNSTVELWQPTWTPGSYLIREFSRHLGRVAAVDAETGVPLLCERVAKNRVHVAVRSPERRLRVSWRVYAHDLSVRTADVTAEHAYWNHACLLLIPGLKLDQLARLTVAYPGVWQLACALPFEPGSAVELANGRRQVTHAACDIDQLLDSPCLVGTFQRIDWTVDGIPHAAVLDGLASIKPPSSLQTDLQAIVEKAAAVFGGKLPYEQYLFLCLFAADGHGGLEHADSTTLLMSRTAFASDKGYREFLSLAAHELFHAWNVKRLRPIEFWRYDYERENYTEFLWLIEGWTAYYDDLLCLRAGLFSRAQYLEVAAKNINGMLAAPGRLRMSLRESSFDAWIRLYRPDENTRNSSQNYYGNGAVAAMYLDLSIRRETHGRASLDDVIRRLYEETYAMGRGYDMNDVDRVLHSIAGPGVVALLSQLVGDRLQPALEQTLAAFAIRAVTQDAGRAHLGVQFETGSTVIASVTAGSAAFESGLHPGDELLAIESLRVDAARWNDVWSVVAKPGQSLQALGARRGVVMQWSVVPGSAPGSIVLETDAAAPQAARDLLEGWLPSLGA